MKWLKYPLFWIIAVFTLAGFILRVYALGAQSFWIDEAFSVNAATAILEHGFPLLDSGILYLRGLLNTYLMAFFMKVFGPTQFGARFVSVLFGTLTIPLMYFFGKELGNKKIGVLTAALVAFSFWEIAWSRQARMYQQLQFFYFLSLLFFYRFVQKPQLKSLFLVLGATIITVLTHRLGASLMIVYLAYGLIVGILQYRTVLPQVKQWYTVAKKELAELHKKYTFVFYFIGSVIAASGIFAAYLLITSVLEMPQVSRNYLDAYFYYTKHVHFLFYYFSIVGALAVLRDLKKGILLLLAYCVPFLIITHLIFLLHYRYIYFILPILFILCAHATYFVWDTLRQRSKLLAGVVAAFILCGIFAQGFIIVPQEHYNLERMTPQPDFEKAYTYIANTGGDEDVIIAAYPAVAKFYLGDVDYWLQFSLSGRGTGSHYVNDGKEVYANATALTSLSEVVRITRVGSGWIVIDTLAQNRIDPAIISYIRSNLEFHEEASERFNRWSGVRVYSWD